MNPLLGSSYRFDAQSGRIVNANHQRIAEIIHDYNPDLELAWIPPENRTAEDSLPFAVIHNQMDGQRYVVFYLSEADLDHRVLARIFSSDMRKNDPKAVINEIEMNEAAERILDSKKSEEAHQERLEFGKALLTSPKHTYRHKGKVYR